MSKRGEFDDELVALDAAGLRRSLRRVESPQGRSVRFGGREVLSFSSNDYLGLSNHPRLVAAAAAAVAEWGVGSGASRLIAGNMTPHERLEDALARWHHAAGARLFNSGYHANVGTLSSVLGPEDVVFSDELNHASIIDGCRLSRARVVVYPHGDYAALRQALRDAGVRRRCVIVSDTVFSMDGDLADVVQLAELAKSSGALLMVDEAHATGVFGPEGRGLCAREGIEPAIHLGTLSKSLGAFGGYVAASSSIVEWLLNRARSFVFTTALPPMIVVAAEESLRLVAGEEGLERRRHLLDLVEQFRRGLADLGLLVAGSGKTPIFPILVGDTRRTMAAAESLLLHGVYAQGIRPPTVPRGTARLRFALSAAHSSEDIDRALVALRACRDSGHLGGVS